MSALGQKQTLRHLQPMSALPRKRTKAAYTLGANGANGAGRWKRWPSPANSSKPMKLWPENRYRSKAAHEVKRSPLRMQVIDHIEGQFCTQDLLRAIRGAFPPLIALGSSAR